MKITSYITPVIILLVICFGVYKSKNTYDFFVDGAAESIKMTFDIMPNIIGIMVAMSMLKASGAINMIAYALSPVLKIIGMPAEIVPLAFLRPISGSGALGIVDDILKTSGPDSYAGRIASIMMGSTETTFYTVAVYYGAAKVKNIRHTLVAALAADITAIICSIIVCRLFFRI